MKANEKLVDTLIESGVDRAFTLPGLGITWTLPAFYDRKDSLEVILCRSEQTASIMAQATGRLTGKPGVFMGQGPWVASTGHFGIIEAFFAASPMLVITDTSDYDGYGLYGCYQSMTGGYGALDIQAVLRSSTKYCAYATTPEEIIFGAQMAYKQANLPRKGPAALIMKTSAIRAEFPETPRTPIYPSQGHYAYTPSRPDQHVVNQLAALLNEAKNPVFVAGNGVYGACCGHGLGAFANAIGAGVVTSYLGKSSVDESAEVACGMLGNWGHPAANRMLQKADLVILMGASMGPDYTRFRDPKMVRPGDQKIVQVDIDPRAAGWVYPVDIAITGDVGDVLSMLQKCDITQEKRASRLETIREIKAATAYDTPVGHVPPPGKVSYLDVVQGLQNFVTEDDIITLDAGNNRIWTTNAFRARHQNQILAPGGAGGMGWGGPAAAAAKLARPDKRITCITGDGGFMMTMDVIATCAQYGIAATFLVMNNSGLGMVRDNLGNRRIACDFDDTDFAKICAGMGAQSYTLTDPKLFGDVLRAAHQHTTGPTVIDIKVDPYDSHKLATDHMPLA